MHFDAAFARGLLDPQIAPPSDVTGGSSKRVDARYNVYRNNVTVSLINALAAVYPAVQRITGMDLFRAMARSFVRAKPPASPLLFEYGHAFPAYIAHYEYAREMPWLSDVARIERAWLDAYHAAEEEILDATALSSVAPSSLAALRFVPHAATRVLRSDYPAVQIFAMNRRDAPVTPICSSDSEDALVTRPADDVIVTHLPPGGAVFLRSLMNGASLNAAVLAAFDEAPTFDLAANLAGMLEVGAFKALANGE
jgi:hypothetical protein